MKQCVALTGRKTTDPPWSPFFLKN